MWTQTRASLLLGLELPILQGPFGGGISSTALTSAVSNAGGLGGFGAVGMAPDEIEKVVAEIKTLTAKPFAVNLWVPISGQDDQVVSEDSFRRALSRLQPLLAGVGMEAGAIRRRPEPPFEAQVEALLRANPPVFSFVMGIPDAAILREIRRQGGKSVAAATTVDEAVALADAGVEVVIASSSEAGGHRGSFLRPVEQSLVGTLSLVPQIVSEVKVPVIAAGGIADGRGIAAALALGAEGVQIGTAFLATEESGAASVHKDLLGTPRSRVTRLTRAITGRHARGMENALMLALEEHPEDVLPYPAQNGMTRELRRAAAKLGRADLLALWAGQSAALARRLPAAGLIRRLVEETDATLRSERLKPRSL